MGYYPKRQKFNFKFLIMKYLAICLILFSCNMGHDKKEISSNNTVLRHEIYSITCSLISLDGKKSIYTIKNNTIESFGKTTSLSLSDIDIINNFPQEISSKDNKYGCGVCVDAVDLEFLFKFKEHQTKYEIEPGSDIPEIVREFMEFLTKKYKDIVNQ